MNRIPSQYLFLYMPIFPFILIIDYINLTVLNLLYNIKQVQRLIN